MDRFCFDYPREVFPSRHQPGLKEGYGRFSGWLPGGIFKRFGRHTVYNPLSSCFPLHKPNYCFLPFEKSLCGGATGYMAARFDRCAEEQTSFYHSTYHDAYIPETILKDLCTEAAMNCTNKEAVQSSCNCLGFRSCDHCSTLGAVYYPSGADMQQITISLLMKNSSLNAQTDAVNTDSFSDYSRTCTTHSAQDVEWYKLPSTISEISVASCQGKDILGVRGQYHCAVFSNNITRIIDDYIQHYEISINQDLESNDLDFSRFQSVEHLGVVRCRKPTSAFCINRQIVGELLLITNDGTLHLWKLDSSIIEPCTLLAASGQSLWWDCCYGAHPFQVMVASSSIVNALDLRNPGQTLTPLYSPGSHTIRGLSPHPVHPYHNIIATSQSLQLLDIRRPLQPFLTVNLDEYSRPHSPFIPSRFMEVTITDALDTMILLPSHQQQLLLQYSGGYVKWDGKSERPIVPAPYLKMNPHSIPHYSSLLTNGPANAASYRLVSPLAGSCIVQSSQSQMGVVELSQLGDLFYHQWNYLDTTEHSKCIDLPAVDKTLWRLWQQEVSLQEKQCLPYQEESLTNSQSIDLTPILKYIIDSGGNMKCLLCHTYQATIGSLCIDETAAPNTCVACGRTLSTTKTSDSTVTSSAAQLLVQSFDVTSLPADEFSLLHDLWQLWGQDQHQSYSSQEHLITSPPNQQIVIPSSSSQRRKRSRSLGTKQIGF